MPGRGATIILLLVVCGLLSTGCVSDTAGPGGTATPEETNRTPATASSGENQTYAYARSLVPLEIPGFVLESRAKQPMTIWDDPYHFHSYWTPASTSTFNGSVQSLSVDTFVFSNREDALDWVRAYEADSAGPLAIQGVNTTYRFRGGVAEVAFMTDDVIAVDLGGRRAWSCRVRSRRGAGTGGRGDRRRDADPEPRVSGIPSPPPRCDETGTVGLPCRSGGTPGSHPGRGRRSASLSSIARCSENNIITECR